jgi:hypothetical protein
MQQDSWERERIMENIIMTKVQQVFEHHPISDIEGVTREQLEETGVSLARGSRIAIAVGSRGIANIHRIVKATVEWIKDADAYPFVVPAMGSHGGATARGQQEVLESYGITEAYINAPIKASMEVVELPGEGLKNRVFMDKNAYEADGTIVINRIKVHTDFHGPVESGLIKMCVIGLGKHKQALEIHKYGVYGLKNLILPTAKQVLKHGNIMLGIGIVENAYDETQLIKGVIPSMFEKTEMELLEYSQKWMPSLPVSQLDVLIVDEMGKDISGVGIDTNIIGRMKIRSEEEPKTPDISSIIVTDLTEGSHGNAIGVGLADVITQNLFQKIDFKATYENVTTSSFLERGKIPIVAESDRQALYYALRAAGVEKWEDARVIRIKNTLQLKEFYVSDSVLEEIQHKENIIVTRDVAELITDNNKFTAF